jgi:hypothetical protein
VNTRSVATIQLVVGIVVVAMGALWMLQGIGVVGGSAMTNQSQWVIFGVIAAAVGVAIAYRGLAARRRLP